MPAAADPFRFPPLNDFGIGPRRRHFRQRGQPKCEVSEAQSARPSRFPDLNSLTAQRLELSSSQNPGAARAPWGAIGPG